MPSSRWTISTLLATAFVSACAMHAAGAPDAILRGSAVVSPEQISGSWESTEYNSVVGLHIQLTTMVKGSPSTLAGVEQTFDHAEIQVYEREGTERKTGDGNWFVDNSTGVQWNGKHLTIQRSTVGNLPAIQLDLTFDADRNMWEGRFKRGDFDHYVALHRPHPHAGVGKSPFVGTWNRTSLMNNCLHIVQVEGGTLAGWSDDLIAPGQVRYANGIPRPTETTEQYGSIVRIETASPTALLVELNAFSPICCSILSTVRLTPSKRDVHTPRSAPDSSDAWNRVQGNSCIGSAPKSRRRSPSTRN